MARDGAVASLDEHATGWRRLLLDGVALGRGDVIPPGPAMLRGEAKEPGGAVAGAPAPRMAIAGMLDFLGLPALVVDRLGRVLEANQAAYPALSGDLRVVNGRLSAGSHRIAIGLRDLVTEAASSRAAPPVVVPRRDQLPLLVYAFPFLDGLPGAPRVARAIVIVLVDLGRTTPPDLHAAAEMLGIRKETARSHLKAIFARTGVQRQSELVALIARLLPVATSALVERGNLLDPQPACTTGVNQVDS